MATPNPFSNFLQSIAADPKAAAEGQYIATNTQLKGAELQKLQGILDARKRLGGYGLSPAAVDAALSNDTFNAGDLFKAHAAAAGTKALIGPDGMPVGNVDPKVAANAAILLGHAPSDTISGWQGGTFAVPTKPGEPELQLVKGENGGPDMIFNKRTGTYTLANVGGNPSPVGVPGGGVVAPKPVAPAPVPAPAVPAPAAAAATARGAKKGKGRGAAPAAAAPVPAPVPAPIPAPVTPPAAPAVVAPAAEAPAAKPVTAADALPNTYQKIVPSTVPGVAGQIVTYKLGPNGQEQIVKVEGVDTRSGQALSNATLGQIRTSRADADKSRYAKAIASGSPFEWMLNKHLGLLDSEGNRTQPQTAVNTVELNSFVNAAKFFHSKGYDMTEAFNEALRYHPGLAAGRGNMEGREWDGSGGFLNPVMGVEKDAGGYPLQDLGISDREWLTSKGFKQHLRPKLDSSGNKIQTGKKDNPDTKDIDESIEYEPDTSRTDYSGMGNAIPVPFEISVVGGGKNSVSNLFATKTATPQVATPMDDEASLLPNQIGKWVYKTGPDGNPTFGIVIKDEKTGKPKFSPVTGELPE
jgi:hypothetical protein